MSSFDQRNDQAQIEKKISVSNLRSPIRGMAHDWLLELDKASMQRQSFPLEQILAGSVYYPSSGFDGAPVKNLGSSVQSFVYADYGCGREQLREELVKHPFIGYQMIGIREVGVDELTPKGWNLPALTPDESERMHYADQYRKEPFCDWIVFERESTTPAGHGPFRFSLLYLCADGAAAFHAMYVNNKLCPSAVALIQPGHGFGRNWTNFYDPNGVLARTVLGNPAGKPECLLYGGWGARKYFRSCPWPYYDSLEGWYSYSQNGNVGVWTRNS